MQRPAGQAGFDELREQAVQIREKIFQMAASEAIPVFAHLMPFPGVGLVERASEDDRFVPAAAERCAW